MINTIMSRKDLKFIEAVIVNYGFVVSVLELKTLFHEMSFNELHQELKLLVKRGWLIRIKQGYYAVANLESHNYSNISPLAISSIFVPGSYVSFEYALNYHGLFDQLPNLVTAVTPLKTKKYKFQNLDFYFVRAKQSMMTGYKEIEIDDQKAMIAEAEKALLDFLHFRKDSYTIDLVLEKLKELRSDITIDRLIEYANLYPVSIQRRIGYLMDICKFESDKLYEKVKKSPGFAKLTRSSNKFNAKWRIYYEDRFAD